MKLEEFALLILFGTRLEDKLVEAQLSLPLEDGVSENSNRPLNPIEVPLFPGRPPKLSKPGKAVFPSLHRLHEPLERGKVLHFFANHELLAVELMALVLLRFPDAPSSFRRGVAAIIQEEQSHLRLYLSRMRELGVDFGDLPVNDYFWNSIRGMRSPLEFTVQMSLTFEQANLDFSLFFMNAIQKVGDSSTSAILERVFREEIGHVKHGVTWFNRWRENSSSETDWDAYLRFLPLPMTPQRAKGYEFCENARRQAGLSETFIRELRVYSGSKGRPPVLWLFNPHCESEIARGKPGFSPTEGSKKLALDLECIPSFLCLDKDGVLVHERPQTEWLELLQKAGFETPEFLEVKSENLVESVKTPKIGGMEPWGWSPDAFRALRPLCSRLVDVAGGNSSFCKKIFSHEDYSPTGLGKFFSKSWSVVFLQDWLNTHPDSQVFFGNADTAGSSFFEWESSRQRISTLIKEGHFAMIKAPYGTSGMQVKRLEKLSDLEGPLGGWIKNTLASQGAIIIERWLAKLFDLSIQMEIREDRIHLLECRPFFTGNQNEYRGTFLGKRFPGFSREQIRFFHSVLPDWQSFLKDLGSKLRSEGYLGPAGVDAFLWKDQTDTLRLKPLVELNPRWTMGRVAFELEKHLAPNVNGIWRFLSLREIKNRGFESAKVFAQEMNKRYPVALTRSGGGRRIQSGVLFTNDPARAKAVVTVLATLPNPDFL